MSKLIMYLVDYQKMSDPYGKFIKTARIAMLPEELQKTPGYSSNHYRVEKKFFKQYEGLEDCSYSGDMYRTTRVRKA